MDASKTFCYFCGKFLTKKNIIRHMESHEDQNFTCDLCGKSFPKKSSFNVHMKIHEANVFECLEVDCKKEYKSESGLIKHILKKHQGELYSCDVCEK